MKARDFDRALKDLESDIARLRALYEQFFQGLERRPPLRLRERIDRTIRQLRRAQPRNTAMRFKYQTVFQRWSSFTQYWDRISRQIEEGTYARDVRRARQRREERERVQARGNGASQRPGVVEVDLDLEMDLDAEIGAALKAIRARSEVPPPAPISLPDMDLEAHPAERGHSEPPGRLPTPRPPTPAPAPRRPPPPLPSPRAVPSATASSGGDRPAPKGPPLLRPQPPGRLATSNGALAESDVRRIFDRFVAARHTTGERPDAVTYEKMASRLRKMEPELRKKHGGKKIDFEVVVRNGKVGLKPVAKD